MLDHLTAVEKLVIGNMGNTGKERRAERTRRASARKGRDAKVS